MVRILTYNILMGGVHRVDPLARLIGSAQPDVVGLVEASNAQVVEEIAQRLGMQCRLSGRGTYRADWQIGVLSRLPILHTQVHTNLAIFARKHLMEVGVEGPDGQQITIFVIHQLSRFHRGPQSNNARRREVQEILRIMAPHQGTPHLVMGDFNSLAPGESFQVSELFRYFIGQRKQFRKQKVKQRTTSPKHNTRTTVRRFIINMIDIAVHNRLLSPLVDIVGRLFAQGGVDLLLQAGYIDCFRELHPEEPGFTIHSNAPVVRIDFIFASPELAQRLQSCTVITEGDGVQAEQASDHLPLCAEFED
ncbi:MAG TPA: endonuclease/exonuclease/phosphatase family protein [Ktedonosporobacter sp.]|nr:endonuclease/exonuclease/phosphatase family protein [Ktedonosporobacter sp.]